MLPAAFWHPPRAARSWLFHLIRHSLPAQDSQPAPATPPLQGNLELVLTLDGQQVPLAVRPADPRMMGDAAGAGSAGGSAAGQGLEVQLPHRILYVRDAGASTAQLVRAEVDGESANLQVLAAGPRQYRLQHCGAHRVVQVRGSCSCGQSGLCTAGRLHCRGGRLFYHIC